MDLQVPSATLAVLLLATVRASGFVILAPPFNSAGIPVAVKGALAMALAVVVFPHISGGLPAITAVPERPTSRAYIREKHSARTFRRAFRWTR